MFKLYTVLVYTFFKPYISKICNDFSLYIFLIIYIYNLEFNWIQNFQFLYPIIHLPQKLKKLDGHVMQNWIPIEIQFRI